MFEKYLKIFKNFSVRERTIFFVASGVVILSILFLIFDFFGRSTEKIPVQGGDISEALVGQPSFINPVIAESGSSEEDLVSILFDSVVEMAESLKVSESGEVWTLRLKEDLRWHDGKPITTDDVIFTVAAIQDPDSRSSLYSSFQGVLVERESEIEMRFVLSSPYSFFSTSLSHLRPLPKHLFGSVPAANFRLSEYNLEPVASGSYKFASLNKRKDGFITAIKLVRNEKYYGKKPYLNSITFKFYEDKETAIKAFNRGLVDTYAGASPKEVEEIRIGHQEKSFRLPRYYAVFFNSGSSPALADISVRRALTMLTDKERMIDEIFLGRAVSASGPVIVGMEGYDPDFVSASFNSEAAIALLESAGWKIGEDGVRAESGERLEFSVVVPNSDFFKETISVLSENFATAGVKLNPIIVSEEEMTGYLQTRNYEMLMFGNAYFGGAADLSSYWQSSERFYPGLNLSLYMDSGADALIESIRKESNEERRKNQIISVNRTIAENYPAIFLYSPNYLYIVSPKLQGVDGSSVSQILGSPSDRFFNVENWYVKTARVSK